MKNSDIIKYFGNKGANLILLRNEGVRIPDFVTLDKSEIDEILKEDSSGGLLNARTQRMLSYPMISVRSSGSHSAPGRMKTVLNVLTNAPAIKQAVQEVAKSAESLSIKKYLEHKGQSEDFTYGIILQEMIQTTGEYDCSGVLTTIHPVTGEQELFGNVAWQQQGDKIMDGNSTVKNLSSLRYANLLGYVSLLEELAKVEKYFDHQPIEVEFCIKDNLAYILQARLFKQITSVDYQFDNFCKTEKMVGKGHSATPFSCTGEITYDSNNCTDKILVINETNMEDTEAIINSKGIITLTGGQLSHAAVVCREFGKPCIVGTHFIKGLPTPGTQVLMHSKGGIFAI